MKQIKVRKSTYRNTTKKEKAASRTRGLSLNSKTYLKSKNATVWIIEYSRRNCTLFFRQTREGRNG
jgi:hypothetical protein